MVFIKKFKKNANKLLIIQNCLPFKESVALYLNKLESCSPNIHALYQVWLILASAVLEKRTKMWKAYNDDGQILIRKAHLSLWHRWANEKLNLCAFRHRPLLIKSHKVFTFGAFQTYHTAPMESVLHVNINFALWSRLLNKGPTTKLHMKVIYVMQKIISSKHSAR